MPSSKLISKIFVSIKNIVNSSYNFVVDFPNWCNKNITNFKNYLIDFKNRLSNLTETNLKLGIYHLHQNNLTDAWLRFKLIDKFLQPNDPTANYWLGWTYYLRNNIPKAIDHLLKAKEQDLVGLLPFLQNIQAAKEVPLGIWQEHRDIIANYYPINFHSLKIHLPLTFIDILRSQLKNDLPDNYTIVELGSNVAMLSYEAIKRLPDKITYIGVESSPVMNELVEIYYPQEKIYDQLLTVSVAEFLNQEHLTKYEIIVSFDGLSFSSDLNYYLAKIYAILKPNGFLALCLKADDSLDFNIKYKKFTYQAEKLTTQIKQSGFTIIYEDEFLLEINNKYIIVVAKKLINKF